MREAIFRITSYIRSSTVSICPNSIAKVAKIPGDYHQFFYMQFYDLTPTFKLCIFSVS